MRLLALQQLRFRPEKGLPEDVTTATPVSVIPPSCFATASQLVLVESR
jgi:hypothetical protein